MVSTSSLKKRNMFTGWGFISPALIYMLIMFLFPLVFSFIITLTDMQLLTKETSFIGLENWLRMFHDQNVLVVMKNTLLFTVVGSTIQYIIGLSMSVLLNKELKGYKFFRVSFLLPMMMAPVAVSYVIGRMTFSESYGPINDILFHLGLHPFAWSTSPRNSMIVLIIIDTWQNVPFFILVLLASLQAIPADIYEAAAIDGAGGWKQFFYITWPLIIPASVTTFIIRALNAFQVIDIIRIVTGGGPGNSTESVTLFAYDIGIKGQDIAYGSTVSFALLLIVVIFTVLVGKFGRLISPRV